MRHTKQNFAEIGTKMSREFSIPDVSVAILGDEQIIKIVFPQFNRRVVAKLTQKFTQTRVREVERRVKAEDLKATANPLVKVGDLGIFHEKTISREFDKVQATFGEYENAEQEDQFNREGIPPTVTAFNEKSQTKTVDWFIRAVRVALKLPADCSDVPRTVKAIVEYADEVPLYDAEISRLQQRIDEIKLRKEKNLKYLSRFNLTNGDV